MWVCVCEKYISSEGQNNKPTETNDKQSEYNMVDQNRKNMDNRTIYKHRTIKIINNK